MGGREIQELHLRVVAGLNHDHKAATLLVDAATNVLWISDGIGSLLGYEADEVGGLPAFGLVHPDDVASIAATLELTAGSNEALNVTRSGQRYVMDVRLRHKAGHWVLVSMHAIPRFHDPNVQGMVLQVWEPDGYRDLFEGMRLLAAEAPLEDVLRVILRAISVGGEGRTVAFIVDDSNLVLAATPNGPVTMGALLPSDFGAWATGWSRESLAVADTSTLWVLGPTRIVHPVDLAMASQVAQLARLAMEADANRASLQAMARFDELTGVANRRQFNEKLSLAANASVSVTVAAVDVDSFKEINDSYGHAVGDLVLVELARILSATLRQDDVVARVGGDEFALLLRGALAADAPVLQRLRKKLKRFTVETDHGKVSVSASLGVASGDLSSLADALRVADENLYEHKQLRRMMLTNP